MIAYLYLAVAIGAEVIATTALRAAQGFTERSGVRKAMPAEQLRRGAGDIARSVVVAADRVSCASRRS